MPTMTKATIVTYQEPTSTTDPNFGFEVFSEITLMQDAGKTDGTWDSINAYTVQRKWLDQDSAQTWINWLFTQANHYNVVITNTQIVDI